MNSHRPSLLAFVFVILGMMPLVFANADEIDFNRDIRPILSENCFYCHGQDANQRQADLRLDVRAAAIDSGAFVPGDAEASELISRILSDDLDTVMPPPDSNRRLSPQQKQWLQNWVAEGAVYQVHWAFTAPTRPVLPEVRDTAWPRGAIDRFVLAKLERQSFSPSPEADQATLIKRLYSDLIGMPPTPDEVDAFTTDTDPLGYEKLVDRLLESEHYGERMSLPWLDAARYADSNGFQQDGDTWQWMWRDWVVRALNDDLPFDQFTIWQLAGDLLPDATTDQLIASGFNRNHLLNGEGGAIAEEQRFNVLFDRIDTTATTWLGLTMACAQCHDHKYDPITQLDYYRLLDAFNHVPESGTPQRFSNRIRVGNPVVELPTAENNARIAEFESQIAAAVAESTPIVDAAFEGWRLGLNADGESFDADGMSESLITLLKKPVAEQSDDDKQAIQTELRRFFDEKVQPGLSEKFPVLGKMGELNKQLAEYKADQIPRPMVMSDSRDRDTHVLDRGGYLSPTEKVTFDTPGFLPLLPDDAPKNRLGFARWLMSPEQPLTARVQINRMWQYFFGTGIVKTSEDFGVQNEYPIHKDLLDWLAVEFRESSWSMKHVNRLILLSATYRQSSRVTPELLERDSDNRLYARATRMRMPSMVLRDWALAAAHLIDRRVGGAPVYPYQPGAVWEALAITKERDFTYPTSSGADLYRRSLYTFWRRTVGPANIFDAANRQTCRVRLVTTSTPLHALTTLNDPTWVEAARVLAGRCLAANKHPGDALRDAFRRVICRPPSDADLAWLNQAYEKQIAIFESDVNSAKELLSVGSTPHDESIDVSQHAALTVVCLGILNLDEALTRE